MSVHNNKVGNDKIFNNKYNTGEMDNASTETIVLDAKYKKTFLEEEYNSETVFRMNSLSLKLIDVIENSNLAQNYKSGKISKNDLSHYVNLLFPYIEEEKTYSAGEKFLCLCDVLDVKENVLFEILPISYRDICIDEISTYRDITSKYQTIKLF